MSPDKYQSYHRTHRYAAPSEAERGKIGRETSRSIKRNLRAKQLSRRIAAAPGDPHDDLLEEYEEQLLAARRDARNAKGHKRRLKELSKDSDFV